MNIEERIAYLVNATETIVGQLRELNTLHEQIQKAEAAVDLPASRTRLPKKVIAAFRAAPRSFAKG